MSTTSIESSFGTYFTGAAGRRDGLEGPREGGELGGAQGHAGGYS